MEHHLIRHCSWLFLRSTTDLNETFFIRTPGEPQPKSPKTIGRELVRALNATPAIRTLVKRGDTIHLDGRLAATCPANGLASGPG